MPSKFTLWFRVRESDGNWNWDIEGFPTLRAALTYARHHGLHRATLEYAGKAFVLTDKVL